MRTGIAVGAIGLQGPELLWRA